MTILCRAKNGPGFYIFHYRYRCRRHGLPGVIGDGILLASLSFSSLVAGDFSLGIVSDLSDFNEGPEHGIG